MSVCRKFRIEGRVQGVWFRESTRKQAERLGITGHALNCRDGSVDVLACGDAGAVNELAEWLKSGPAMARVHRVSHSDYSGECPLTFTTG